MIHYLNDFFYFLLKDYLIILQKKHAKLQDRNNLLVDSKETTCKL